MQSQSTAMNHQLHCSMHKSNFLLQVNQAYTRLMAKKEEACLSVDHVRLRHLLEVNVKMQCWDQAAALCQKLAGGDSNQSGQAAELSQLSVLSSVLTDKLAVDVETAASMGTCSVHIPLLLPKLHRELSAYRSQLLLSEACLSSTSLLEGFDQVAQLCQPIQDTLKSKPQHMLSLFSSMQALVKQQQVVLSQLQGQTKSVSCTLQPVHLRLSDLISLFCPQFREACSHLMDVQSNVQQSMNSAQQVTKLDYNVQVSLQNMPLVTGYWPPTCSHCECVQSTPETGIRDSFRASTLTCILTQHQALTQVCA